MDETRSMPETGYEADAVPPTAVAPVTPGGSAGDPYYEDTPPPNPRPRRTLRLVLAALVIAAVSAGVTAIALGGGDDDDSPSEDNAATESASDSTEAPTTTAPPSTTATTAAPSTTAAPTTTVPAPAPDTSAFPPEATLEHGGHTFGVYLALSDDPEDPALAAARDKAAEAGYLSTNYAYGSLGCDEGAPEALEASTDTMAVAVYFATEAQANQAKDAFATIDQPVVGVVPVINYCLD
jgi:hypothetical protein